MHNIEKEGLHTLLNLKKQIDAEISKRRGELTETAANEINALFEKWREDCNLKIEVFDVEIDPDENVKAVVLPDGVICITNCITEWEE